MKIGQKIIFEIETWVGDKFVMKECNAIIIRIDPSEIHESKCIVEINNDLFGIPFSRVKKIMPAVGEQLALF